MLSKITIVCIFCTLSSYKAVQASNIDLSYPIIIKNSADGAESFFGATVLLVKQRPGIIIGAPKANSTLPNHKDINEPGVVWQCFFDESKTANVCRVLVMDPTGNEISQTEKVHDRKDEGWLGGALAKDNENFVSCSSRWSNQIQTEKYFMNGICYWRSNHDLSKEILPTPSRNSRLIPLLDETKQGQNNFGMGQAGFSVHISTLGKELVIGAPGVNAWKGSIVRYSNGGFGQPFSDPLVLHPEKSQEILKDNGYFGYSISSGHFLNDSRTQPQYVSGAPRANNLAGKVIIFRFPETNDDKLEKLFEIDGNQLGSYFGSSLCVADVNGDGLDDLLIGAPRYSSAFRVEKKFNDLVGKREFLGGNIGHGDEGTVFIYLSNGKAMIPQSSGGLTGRNRPWAQFGTAITNLGDIDNDRYDDIAIGAPYENNGLGIVYIFKGSEHGIQKKYSQLIEASTIDINLRGFGFSFSEAEDIDSNGYNDLAVGAYDSGHVVILRTKPLVIVSSEIKSNIKRLPFDTISFEVESCISYIGAYVPDRLDLNVKISIDVNFRPNRVLLKIPEQGDSTASEHTYQEEAQKGSEACTKFIAVVVEPLESSGKPIVIRQEISLVESSKKPGPTIFEIKRFASQVTTQISGLGYNAFCKDCPMIDMRKFKIEEISLPLAVPCGDDDKCVSDLRLDVRFTDLTPDATYIIGSTSVLPMEIKLSNLEETAISPAIVISWKSRKLRKIPSECQIQLQNSNDTFTTYKCSLGRTLEKGRYASVNLDFEMSDLVAGSLDEFWIHVEAITASDMIKPVFNTFVLPLIAQADISIIGDASVIKFNPTTLLSSVNFYQSFELYLDGPSTIAGLDIEFLIPTTFKSSSGSTVKINVYEPDTTIWKSNIRCLALTDSFDSKTSVDISSRSISSSDYTDYEENITEESEAMLNAGFFPREKVSDQSHVFSKISRSEFTIKCDSSSVKCMKVRCTTDTYFPNKSATVVFPMSISTKELKSIMTSKKYGTLKLVSEGSVKITGVDIEIQPTSQKPDYTIAITIIELESTKKVSKWIYTVSIMIGFFVLACLGICFYSCGCCKRKKKPGQETGDEKDGPEPESIPLKNSSPFDNNMDD